MLFFAPCKINIGLNIVSKRSDGYHNIETVFYPVPMNDVIEIIPRADLKADASVYANGLSFNMSGSALDIPSDENLCVKAFQLLRNDFSLPDTWMHLMKSIPTGAGLGGGSSDAASVLTGLNTIYNLNLSAESLMEYAIQLGSDCAFFIEGKPCIAKGRGEQLEKTDLFIKHHHIAIVKPQVSVATSDAYKLIDPKVPDFPVSDIWKLRIDKWNDFIRNDFEAPVFKLHPEIKVIKDKLIHSGAQFVMMSGSGSAVYAISYMKLDIENSFSDCFVWQGIL